MDIEALMNETPLAGERPHVDEVRRRLFDPLESDEPATDDLRHPPSSRFLDGLTSAVMVLLTVAATVGLCVRRAR